MIPLPFPFLSEKCPRGRHTHAGTDCGGGAGTLSLHRNSVPSREGVVSAHSSRPPRSVGLWAAPPESVTICAWATNYRRRENVRESGISVENDALKAEIQDYVKENGGVQAGYGWYVGVTNDPEHQLFTTHNVNKAEVPWIYGEADTAVDAQQLRDDLILNYSFRGDPAIQDDSFSGDVPAAVGIWRRLG